MMERISRIRDQERRIIQEFLLIDDWRRRISAVFVMLASPEDSMSREQGVLPVEGSTGSIMNHEVLEQILEINKSCVAVHQQDFRIIPIATSAGDTRGNPQRTAEVVTEVVLGLVEEQISEDILSCSKGVIKKMFGDGSFIGRSKADELARIFSDRDGSDYRPREEVENDLGRVQPLPIVVVRNRSGEILRLRRRERRDDNALHNTVVIWAGGHVRSEDAINGNPLIECASPHFSPGRLSASKSSWVSRS